MPGSAERNTPYRLTLGHCLALADWIEKAMREFIDALSPRYNTRWNYQAAGQPVAAPVTVGATTTASATNTILIATSEKRERRR